MRDFTLKVEVKLSANGANGGIQYRSRLLHPRARRLDGRSDRQAAAAGITTMRRSRPGRGRGRRRAAAPGVAKEAARAAATHRGVGAAMRRGGGGRGTAAARTRRPAHLRPRGP